MKLLLKILGIIILIVVVLAFILPIIFKDQIIEVAKDEANKNLNARVEFSDLSLSLFKNFPHFSLSIDDFTLAGKEKFEGDTLADISSLIFTIDLMSVINGDVYEIKNITIENPSLNVLVLEDGTANYDIAMDSGTPEEPESATEEGEPAAYNIQLRKFEIINLDMNYQDMSTGIHASVNKMSYVLRGNFTQDVTSAFTRAVIESLTVKYGGVKYLNNTRLQFKADVNADMKNSIYTLKDNELQLNQVVLGFDGSVSMIGEDINLVLSFATEKTEFKNFLSLIPAVYKKDFEQVETSGNFVIDGSVKGIYNENQLPSFNINMGIEDARFQYPELPAAVTDIAMDANISNPGGDADQTSIDVSRFHVQIAQNPVDISLKITTPVSDPDIDGKINGKLDLADIEKIYPLEEDMKLSGVFTADVNLAGQMSAIEEERYEDFIATGSLLVRNMNYQSNDLPPVQISNAQMNFAPSYLDLVSFKMNMGESDLSANGKVENYLLYAMKDGTLTGDLSVKSSYFNMNQFMEDDEASTAGQEETTTEDTVSLSVVEVPERIQFSMSATFTELVYDNMDMTNVSGNIEIADQQVILSNLTMNLLDGGMSLNGKYSTKDPENPFAEMDLDINNLAFPDAYNTFGMIEKFAPIAKKLEGTFSTEVSLSTNLKSDMMPDYNTFKANGQLTTSKIILSNVNVMNKIAEAVKLDKLKKMTLDPVQIAYEIREGKLFTEPFDIDFDGSSATIEGWTAISEEISYDMNMKIPSGDFGSAANEVLSGLAGGSGLEIGKFVTMGIDIGGTVTDPKVSVDLKETTGSIVEDVKETIKEKVGEKKEELEQKAKEEADKILKQAEEQANKVIQEAEKKAAQIRNQAQKAAKAIREEADKKAAKVEKEGADKGFLAEKLARESAKKIRDEADNKADKLINEADKEAQGIINAAKKRASQIRSDAKNKADNL